MLGLGATFLAFAAGALSILSPCVLPIVPIAFAGALSAHRLGPLALAAGVALSFTVIGLFVATLGFSIGLGEEAFQSISAGLLIALGLVLLVPMAQARLAVAAGPVSNWIDARLGGFSGAGLSGQFGLGLLFGAIWSPCTGPTLGAAALMAANRQSLPEVALVMLSFGIGASVPLALLASLSRARLMRWRDKIMGTSRGGKMILGAILIVSGVLILTGLGRAAEAFLVAHSPDWLTALAARY
jgi:cytochrome c biogenesis protein CcdA